MILEVILFEEMIFAEDAQVFCSNLLHDVLLLLSDQRESVPPGICDHRNEQFCAIAILPVQVV